MNKTQKLQKPIDADIHLKYRCKKCGIDHWLSFKEASTKNFKVVCYCGSVFKVKQLSGFKFKYEDSLVSIPIQKEEKTEEKKKEINQSQQPEPQVTEIKPQSIDSDLPPQQSFQQQNVVQTQIPAVVQNRTIPSDLLEKSVKLLLSYGFTKTEATELIIKTYFNVPVDDYATLVKYTLQSIGDLDNGIDNTASL